MTEIYVLTFIVLGITLMAMAVGVIFSNKKLKGSCGGLGAVMGEDCMFCEKKEQCDKNNKENNKRAALRKLPAASSPFDVDPARRPKL